MNRQSLVRSAVIWAAALATTTVVLLALRPKLELAHVALVLLLVVLGASAAGGRVLGLATAAASFLLFDWFFLPPYGTLVITNPLDWLVLIAFLLTSIVAAQLLHREQEATREATERAAEVDGLASIGAEALNAPRAVDALARVVSVIRSSTGVGSCSVYLVDDSGVWLGASTSDDEHSGRTPALVEWVAREGAPAAELEEGTTRLGSPGVAARDTLMAGGDAVRDLLLPLVVRGRSVGVLRLHGGGVGSLDTSRWRYLDTLSFYAALGAERVRLAADAGHVEALREADRLKDALIASVSHDLRTPLTTIKALAHALGALGDERSQVIEEQADRLNRYVADLLDLSRLSAGSMPSRIELNAVDDLLTAAVQEVEGCLGGRRLDVRLPEDGELLVGKFDLAQSIRALVNLLENAHKYSPPASPVVVRARRVGPRVVITVSDRGPGVAPGEEERIFSPFYRAPGTPDVGSAGLGLAIARRLAEAQGGAVTYAPAVGGGSEFALSLPAADASEVPVPEAVFTKS